MFCHSAIESAQNDHAAVVQSILENKDLHGAEQVTSYGVSSQRLFQWTFERTLSVMCRYTKLRGCNNSLYEGYIGVILDLR